MNDCPKSDVDPAAAAAAAAAGPNLVLPGARRKAVKLVKLRQVFISGFLSLFCEACTMHLKASLCCLWCVLLAPFVSSGNIPASTCGPLLVHYTQMSEELEQIPALLRHLTGLFQEAKQRLGDAQAELNERQSRYKDCKVMQPDEDGWTPPDVCRLTLEPEIQGYQVIAEDNQKLMDNMSPSIQAAEVRHAELTRDTEQLRSQLVAQNCPPSAKMSPAPKHVGSESKKSEF